MHNIKKKNLPLQRMGSCEGLIGNAVKIGNSSRCCKFYASIQGIFSNDPSLPAGGKTLKRTSQNTCPCLYDFTAYG